MESSEIGAMQQVVENLCPELDIAPELKRTEIVEFVRRWGGPASDAVLDPVIEYFSDPEISGVVGYRKTAHCAVVYGDPICSQKDLPSLAKAFHAFADQQGFSIVYLAASQEFARWAIQHVCGALIEFGEELFYDPSCDPRKRTGNNGSLVRRKVKRAIKEGVEIHEYLGSNSAIESQIEQMGAHWLKSRRGPQIHISNVYLFDDRYGKRWLYAKQGEQVIGSISLNLLESKQGWLINHLMVIPEAPNGTSELLFTTALEMLAKEGCRFATVGMINAKDLGEIVGLSRLSTFVARLAFKIARKIFHLDGLHTFWGKFHPEHKPSYLLFSRSKVGFREVLAISRATNAPL